MLCLGPKYAYSSISKLVGLRYRGTPALTENRSFGVQEIAMTLGTASSRSKITVDLAALWPGELNLGFPRAAPANRRKMRLFRVPFSPRRTVIQFRPSWYASGSLPSGDRRMHCGRPTASVRNSKILIPRPPSGLTRMNQPSRVGSQYAAIVASRRSLRQRGVHGGNHNFTDPILSGVCRLATRVEAR